MTGILQRGWLPSRPDSVAVVWSLNTLQRALRKASAGLLNIGTC